MEDVENMDCEEIINSGNNRSEVNVNMHDVVEEDERPHTPENNISIIHVQDYEQPMTPPNTVSPLDEESFLGTPNVNDSNFINRHGIEKIRHGAIPRLTSTPLYEHDRLSNTLPSTFAVPHFARLKRIHQCRSAETVRPRFGESEDLVKIGPNAIPIMYINPFTPDGKLLESKIKAHRTAKRLSLDSFAPPKFSLNDSTGSEIILTDIPRKPKLRELNVSRFNVEFVKLEEIGKGVHGCVYKCVNRMNGCLYAIKKTLQPVKTGNQERVVRNEIYAHGLLFHNNIVRNFSCWNEDNYVFIQNEYCNGGNLESYIRTNKTTMSETLLRSLMLQIASALKCMHEMGLAHMDVKPGNIFLCTENTKETSLESDGGFSDDDKSEEIIFKLGDLGHVSKLDDDDPEEGDCRYLAREIIQEDFRHIDRADVFSLGLTVFEAAGGGPLPKNGEVWQEIRDGKLPTLKHLSEDLNNILKSLVNPIASERPSAANLVQMLMPSTPAVDEVSTYIHDFRRTSTRLQHTALATNQYLKVLYKSTRHMQEQLQKDKVPTPPKEKLANAAKKKAIFTQSRIIGRKTTRSSSTTLF